MHNVDDIKSHYHKLGECVRK